MNSPTIGVEKCLTTTTTTDNWIQMCKEVIRNQEQGVENDTNIARKAAKFVIIGDDLYNLMLQKSRPRKFSPQGNPSHEKYISLKRKSS